MEGSPIPVEILHTETCGNWPLAVAAVRRVADEFGIAVTISDFVVDTPEAAQALRFPGSPTIRVRGRDLQPQAEERGDFGLG
jgi:hypothetical protein